MERRSFLKMLAGAAAALSIPRASLVEAIVTLPAEEQAIVCASYDEILATTVRAYLPVITDAIASENVFLRYIRGERQGDP